MAHRQRIATGRTLPAGLVSLYEELYPTRSGGWQIRWTLEGIGTATRTKPTKSAARQFQSELRRAIAAGEPFDTGTREPAVWSEPVIVEEPTFQPASLLEFARQHIARRWPELKPTSRGSMIETYAIAVWAHLPELRPQRRDAMAWVRRALVPGPQAAERLLALPSQAQQAGRLIEQGSLPVADLADREAIERMVGVLKCRADGTAYAPTVVTRHRRLLNQLLDAAVRAEHLDSNPLELTQPPRRRNALRPVGEREVIGVAAGIALLELCATDTRTDRLTAYFGCGFWAGMRPAEIEGMNWTDDQGDLYETFRTLRGGVLADRCGATLACGTRQQRSYWPPWGESLLTYCVRPGESQSRRRGTIREADVHNG